jgi:hypothetical protein
MLPVTPCLRCRHYRGRTKCAAFPDGIPERILDGKSDHTRPYPGDNGIRFESIDSPIDPDADEEEVILAAAKSLKNCGTGAGGFKPGNDCAAGDGSGSGDSGTGPKAPGHPKLKDLNDKAYERTESRIKKSVARHLRKGDTTEAREDLLYDVVNNAWGDATSKLHDRFYAAAEADGPAGDAFVAALESAGPHDHWEDNITEISRSMVRPKVAAMLARSAPDLAADPKFREQARAFVAEISNDDNADAFAREIAEAAKGKGTKSTDEPIPDAGEDDDDDDE